MTVIETHDLTKRYREVLAVDRVSFGVERGQIFGFLGPNGSGKTTTIGMLVGIVTPTAGSFRVFGASAPGDLVTARARVGATLETPNFYPYLNGRDNLRIAATIKGVGEDRIQACLEIVGLADRAKHRFRTYSLGMKQRLALAATMLADPELIILDEPANGLDPQGMREVRDIILMLAERGKTVFLSSHLLWEVERTCTHVAIVRKGRIVASGTVGDVASGGTMAKVRADVGAGGSLHAALEDYPDATAVRTDDSGSSASSSVPSADAPAAGSSPDPATCIVSLRSDDLAALNRYLAGRGIYASHLSLHRRSLEDAFIDLTGGSADDSEPPGSERHDGAREDPAP